MKHVEVGPCIIQYENLFSPGDFIPLLEDECKRDWGYLNWYQTTVGSNSSQTVTNYRSSLGCELAPLQIEKDSMSVERLKPLADKWLSIREKIETAIWHYRNMYSLNMERDEGFRVLKYGRGAEYKGHVDHHPDNARILSLVGFLNDDFSGGELVFPLFDVTVKPKAGSIVLFPSNFPYYHYANAAGAEDETIKYSFVTWFQ